MTNLNLQLCVKKAAACLVVALLFFFNAFGQTKSYSINRVEEKTSNGARGNFYANKAFFIVLNERSKFIIILNAKDNTAFTFKIIKTTLDMKYTNTIHEDIYTCSTSDADTPDAIVSFKTVGKIITIKYLHPDLHGDKKTFVYYY